MTKMLCGWCKKSVSKHPEWFRGMHLHRKCKKEMISFEKKLCNSCKINFSRENPEYKKSQMHKKCFELIRRREISIKNPFKGGTGSKK